LTIIFAPTKHRKMPKLFSSNHFTPKQTKHQLQTDKQDYQTGVTVP